jgi:hypothetical protein
MYYSIADAVAEEGKQIKMLKRSRKDLPLAYIRLDKIYLIPPMYIKNYNETFLKVIFHVRGTSLRMTK